MRTLVISKIQDPSILGWSGGAMGLGNFQCQGVLLYWIRVGGGGGGEGATALAVGAGGVIWTFLLLSVISLFFLILSGRRPDID